MPCHTHQTINILSKFTSIPMHAFASHSVAISTKKKCTLTTFLKLHFAYSLSDLRTVAFSFGCDSLIKDGFIHEIKAFHRLSRFNCIAWVCFRIEKPFFFLSPKKWQKSDMVQLPCVRLFVWYMLLALSLWQNAIFETPFWWLSSNAVS